MKTVEPTSEADQAITRFRARLMRRRDEAGLSRRQLAIQTGIDPSTLTRLELGSRVPSFEMAGALAEALKVPMADFFGTTDIEDADLAALERAQVSEAEAERVRVQRRAGADTWPMRGLLSVGQGVRCCYPFEPCTCRIWVAPDADERMNA